MGTRSYVAFLAPIIAISSLLIFTFGFFNIFNPVMNGCGNAANVSVSARFTVVIDQSGYNGSRYHTGPWPQINVTVGQGVAIHVWNNDTIQAHGFAIAHYFNQGIALRPGQSCDVVFTASQAGTFPIFNTIVDTTEMFEHSQLNVFS
jgi:heme/copper-type cytochrome/quinol oxidase subunit 2